MIGKIRVCVLEVVVVVFNVVEVVVVDVPKPRGRKMQRSKRRKGER